MELDQVDASGRRWRRFCTCGQEFHVNMSVLEPYLQVLSHGGQEDSVAPWVRGPGDPLEIPWSQGVSRPSRVGELPQWVVDSADP